MALTPNFTASQAAGVKAVIILTDTSTGSDDAITQRRAFFQKSDGSYLVPSDVETEYVEWDYSDVSLSVSLLESDQALNITVQWLNVDNDVLYSKTLLYVFTPYSKTFFYYLTQLQSASEISNDTYYYQNKAKLWVEINSAINAILYGADISASQDALDRAALLVSNQSLYF